nr:uncharacterized protein LOC104647516 [Solanum lycopersicum]
MICFVTGVSDDLQEECHLAILHDNMKISRLMVHAKHVEEARAKKKGRDAKRARSFEFPKARDDKVTKPRAQKGRNGNSPNEKPTCAKYGKGLFGECLVGTGNRFGCGKNGHKVRYCPNMKG